MIIAHRFHMGEVHEFAPVAGAGLPLPNYSVGPRVYQVGAQAYDTTLPGLYSFMDTQTLNFKRRVSWNQNASDRDGNIYRVVSACAWNMVHGVADETADMMAIAYKFATGKVQMRCGYQVLFMLWWLPQYCPTYELRQVGLLTGATPTGYDDGHAAFEAKVAGAWRLFDIDQKCYYTDAAGCHLSMLQIIEAGGPGACVRVPLSADMPYSYGRTAGGFDMGCYCDTALRTPEQRSAWSQRIYQIPAINNAAYLPAGHEGRAAWVASLGYSVLPKATWLSTFY